VQGFTSFARNDIADEINKLGQRASHKFWDIPVVKGIRRINAMLKSTLLSVSMFHHMAGIRSYVFGVKGIGWQRLRPIKAYREGLKKIDQQTGFNDPNYKHLGPIVDLLAREGLTLGRTQDWDGDMLMDSFVEEFLKKSSKPGASMALKGWQGARRWKRQWTNGLFGRLFAGLKAQSAAVELTHKMNKFHKKHGRGMTDAEVKVEAIQTARLINADFGGLHLSRMGRSPDAQKVLQMFLLAPDWTESNWRTVTGMVPGMNKAITKLVGDNPPPPGMGSVYRKFWGGIAIRGVLSTLAAQWAVLALFGDDDDRAEYLKQLQQAVLSREEFAKGNWLKVDMTPAFRKLNLEPKGGKRVAFNMVGHFKDILKVMTPVTLAKHKLSPVSRLAESTLTRTDWKGDRFKTIGELWEDGIGEGLVADPKKAPRDPEGWMGAASQLVAAGAYNLRQSLPIPLSEMLVGAQGESSMLSAVMKAGGVDVRDVNFRDPNEHMYWEKTQEIKKLQTDLDDARKLRDPEMKADAKEAIREYDSFNKVKARLGFAKVQLRPINSAIRDLKLKQEKLGLTESDMAKLRAKQKRKDEIYRKFAEVIGRF
jgi:hypothetical protein